MKKVPFRLDVEIRTPLAGGDIPTLDAVLLAEHARLNPDAPDYARHPGEMREVLNGLLKVTDCGVPHASALLFDARAKIGETNRNTRRPRELEELGPRRLKEDILAGREMRRPKPDSWINHALIANCGEARFLGVGDCGEIERVLAHWQGIGAQWRNGWGEIANDGPDDECEQRVLNIHPMRPGECNPETWGLLDEDGAPARPLPPELFWSLPGRNPALAAEANKRARPPYWANTPRIPVVVRGAGISAKSDMEDDSPDVAEFVDDRFARYMLPGTERTEYLQSGGPVAAVRRALEKEYKKDPGEKRGARLQKTVAVITPGLTRFAVPADRLPEGERDKRFKALPGAETGALLFDAAMNEKSDRFVVAYLERETIRPEHLYVNSGASDFIVICGRQGHRNIGGFSRNAIRRILAVAESRGLSHADLKKMKGDEHPDLSEQAEDDDELCELRRLLFGLSPAGELILKNAPLFRRGNGGNK